MKAYFFYRFAHNPQELKSFFYLAEILFLGLVGFTVIRRKLRRPVSGFRVWEADLRKQKNKISSSSESHHFNPTSKDPLRLEGIQLHGLPHEILGIPQNAPVDKIQEAYRKLMKRYHPDRIRPIGSQAWKDAQKIAKVINDARAKMLRQVPKS